MKRTRLSVLATIVIALSGVFANVSAQKTDRPVPWVEPLNGTYTMRVNANELSAGDSKFELQETVGWTSYGKTDGDLSGFMFISLNYTLPKQSVDPKDGRPEPVPQTSQITGGSWSKLIFRDGQYAGSVCGRIASGEIVWSQTDLNATIHLELTSEGGTGSFVGSNGKGMFDGTLDRMGKSSVAIVAGDLILDY